MKASFAIVLALLAACNAENWAVLICGSHTYMNYRHHADVCHAWHILRNNGIPASNIILFLYDDVAQSSQNPFPGQLFNKPSTGAGEDVYAGCKDNIDYRGNDVTAANLLKLLSGADMTGIGSGKTLKSGPNDHVFINFVDHGGVGLIAMPSGPFLYAPDLVKALQGMHDNKQFQKLVFYMEACESGSMFANLPDTIEIFATTAANADQSSWGTYCPPQSSVNGKQLNTCLGDLYSVNWMENSDSKGAMSETLQHQYDLVKQETTRSEVCKFGNETWTSDAIGQFQANGKYMDRDSLFMSLRGGVRPQVAATQPRDRSQDVHVDSRKVARHTLMHQFSAETDPALKAAAHDDLATELRAERDADRIFDDMSRRAVSMPAGELMKLSPTLEDFDCFRAVNEQVVAECGDFTDYSIQYTRVVALMCEKAGYQASRAAVTAVCA